ncbi:MAG: PEP-CTERM sorting domain-containing protein [Verrucomicrobiota bacterium]
MAIACLTAISNGQVIYTQMDTQRIGGRVESGFVEGLDQGDFSTFNLVAPNSDAFNLIVSGFDQTDTRINGLDNRDRGDSTSGDALVQVAEDMFYAFNGFLRVQFQGLDVGTYELDLIMVEPQFGGSDLINISVTDPTRTNTLVATANADKSLAGISNVDGLSQVIIESNYQTTLSFTSNGVDDVFIWLDGRSGTSNALPLNGIVLTQVPEPSAFMLVGLGLGILVVRIQRAKC